MRVLILFALLLAACTDEKTWDLESYEEQSCNYDSSGRLFNCQTLAKFPSQKDGCRYRIEGKVKTSRLSMDFDIAYMEICDNRRSLVMLDKDFYFLKHEKGLLILTSKLNGYKRVFVFSEYSSKKWMLISRKRHPQFNMVRLRKYVLRR